MEFVVRVQIIVLVLGILAATSVGLVLWDLSEERAEYEQLSLTETCIHICPLCPGLRENITADVYRNSGSDKVKP